jgi:hypothetical protein
MVLYATASCMYFLCETLPCVAVGIYLSISLSLSLSLQDDMFQYPQIWLNLEVKANCTSRCVAFDKFLGML